MILVLQLLFYIFVFGCSACDRLIAERAVFTERMYVMCMLKISALLAVIALFPSLFGCGEPSPDPNYEQASPEVSQALLSAAGELKIERILFLKEDDVPPEQEIVKEEGLIPHRKIVVGEDTLWVSLENEDGFRNVWVPLSGAYGSFRENLSVNEESRLYLVGGRYLFKIFPGDPEYDTTWSIIGYSIGGYQMTRAQTAAERGGRWYVELYSPEQVNELEDKAHLLAAIRAHTEVDTPELWWKKRP